MADRGNRGRPSRSERADRQINAGHSRALDAALARTEARIRNLKTEMIYAFDENGKELAHSTTGSEHSTKLPKGNYDDAIITHNHPQSWMSGKGLGERIGTPFSASNIVTTAMFNAKEIRSVTRGGYTFSIKRPKGGWKTNILNTNKMITKITTKVAQIYHKYLMAEAERNRQRWGVSTSPDEKYNKLFYERNHINAVHQALKELSKEYGFEYTRKRTYSFD